jgi:hypothetical protein
MSYSDNLKLLVGEVPEGCQECYRPRHDASRLVDRVQDDTDMLTIEQAQQQIREQYEKHCPVGGVVVGSCVGNSITCAYDNQQLQAAAAIQRYIDLGNIPSDLTF